jgi:hypothetical protein
LTEAELQQAREDRRRAAARIGGLARLEGWTLAPLAREIDPRKNFFSGGALRFDGSGRLWVRTDRGDAATTVFDLFSPAGDFIGEVRAEAALGSYHIANRQLAAVSASDLDVPIIRVFRVPN